MSSEEATDTTLAVSATVMPAGSDLTRAEAEALDQEIDRHLDSCAQLLRSYLDTGHHLARMRETKGFAALGYRSWGNYLDSKQRFGRTFLSYLLKLGRAGDPQVFVENEIPPAMVIEYIRQVDYPEKVHNLIAATWEDVKDLPAKVAGKRVQQYVEVHAAEFKKPRKGRKPLHSPEGTGSPEAGPTVEAEVEQEATPPVVPSESPAIEPRVTEHPPDRECQFEEMYRQLSDADRKSFVRAMRDFLDSRDDMAS